MSAVKVKGELFNMEIHYDASWSRPYMVRLISISQFATSQQAKEYKEQLEAKLEGGGD